MNNKKIKLDVFQERMIKIGVKIEYMMNFPWVYITKINGKKIHEKQQSEHGFVIGFMPIREGKDFVFVDLKDTFSLIRSKVYVFGNKKNILNRIISKINKFEKKWAEFVSNPDNAIAVYEMERQQNNIF